MAEYRRSSAGGNLCHFLEETRVWSQEPDVHEDGEDRADADADKDEVVVRDAKMTRADEDHGKSLEHCTTDRQKRINLVDNEKKRTCVYDAIRD
jgi:hypothetical protein